MALAARTGAWTPSSAPLPYDAEVEYLESTGTQYIDTGIKCEIGLAIYMKFRPLSGGVTWQDYFGGSAGDGYRGYRIRQDNVSYSKLACIVGGGQRNVKSITVGNFHTVEIEDDVILIDGVIEARYTTTQSYYDNNVNLYLFSYSLNNSVFRKSKMRLASFSILHKIELIPVRFTNENGVSEGAMYDRVSGQLFRNAGTGSFVIGPDKVSQLGGYNRKCVRRSYRRSARPSARFYAHSQEWEVAA